MLPRLDGVSVVRRTTEFAEPVPAEDDTLLRFGDLTVDTASVDIHRVGRQLDLTP